MAVRLPTFVDLGEVNIHPGDVRPQFMGASPEGAALAVEGQGLQALGTGLSHVGAVAGQFQAQQNQLAGALGTAELGNQLFKRQQDIKNETDPKKLDALTAELPTLLDQVAEQIPEGRARNLWIAQNRQHVLKTELLARDQHRKIFDDNLKAGSLEKAEGIVSRAQQAPDDAARIQANNEMTDLLTTMADAGTISRTTAQQLASDYHQRIVLGHAQYLDQLERSGEAREFLLRNRGNIPQEKIAELEHTLRGRERSKEGRDFYEGLKRGATGNQTVRQLGEHKGPGTVTPQQVAAVGPKYGFTPAEANAYADIESSHGSDLGTGRTHGGNILQLGETERAEVGVKGGMGTPDEQLDYGFDRMARMRDKVEGILGRKLTPGEVFVVHNQGDTGFLKLLNNPDKRAVEVVDPGNIIQNPPPDLQGDKKTLAARARTWTSKQFLEGWYARVDRGIAKYANVKAPEPGAPAKPPEGLVEPGNIDLNTRPVVRMPDGRIATVRSMSFNDNNNEVLIPTISDDGRVMTDDEAIEQYRRTGRHLGKFDTPAHADAFAKNLSQEQGKQYGAAGGAPAPAGPTRIDWQARAQQIQNSRMSDEAKQAAITALAHDKQVQELGQAEAQSDLLLGIANGTKNRADIESLYQAGRISPAARTAANAHFDKIEETARLQAEAITRIEDAGAGGAPLDPKSDYDKKALNFHYGIVSKGWAPAETYQRGIAYSAVHGMIPEQLKGTIRGGLHSGRPELMVSSANAIDQLRNTNPALVNEIGDESDMRAATMISAYTRAGVNAQEAVRMSTEALKVPKAVQEVRKEEFDLARGKDVTERRNADDDWLKQQLNSFWRIDPSNIPGEMRQDFDLVTRSEYEKTGSLEAARLRGLDHVNKIWGQTRIGGDNRYMRYSPERFYGLPTLSLNENTQWIGEQLVADLKKGALPDPDHPIDTGRVRLEHAYDRATPDGRPGYYVFLVSPIDKKRIDQVKDLNQNGMLWAPDWDKSPEKARRGEEQQRKTEGRQQLRQELGRGGVFVQPPLGTPPLPGMR
jgi:hypothetical protein